LEDKKVQKLNLKNAIITSNEITIIKKKCNIVVTKNDIRRIDYTKPTFWSCLIAGLLPDGTFPGYLRIILNKKISKSKTYIIKIKFEDILKLPEVYLKEIDPSNRWGWINFNRNSNTNR